MEASKKPQLPLDTTGEGTVRVLEDRIVVEDLTIADRDTARVVRERAEAGEEPTRTVERTIEIGARVLDREDSAAEVDFVRREFERMAAEHREQLQAGNKETAERIEAEIRRAFGAGDSDGVLAAALDTHSSDLTEQLAEVFGDGRDSAVQARIKKMLEERDQAFLQRLSADDETNPMRPLLSTVKNWATERRKDQDERDNKLELKLDQLLQDAAALAGMQRGSAELAEAEEAGTRKGRSFEDRVHAVLESIAAERGDVAHHVGDTSAEEGGKKGDTIIEIGGGEGSVIGRIAFEAKTDRSLTRPEAWRELNGASEKRGAGYAVMVVAGDECVPSNTKPWIEYEGNKMIVSVDREEPEQLTLEAAYAIARARVLARGERDLQIDAAGVRDSAQELLSEAKQFSTVKKHLTGVTNSAENARTVITSMEESMRAIITRIDQQVGPAAD